MTYMNPTNRYIETANYPWLWCLLFGPFYFASKGCWFHAVLACVLAPLTFGISILIYPCLAAGIVDRAYLRAGWVEYEPEQWEPASPPPAPKPAGVSVDPGFYNRPQTMKTSHAPH